MSHHIGQIAAIAAEVITASANPAVPLRAQDLKGLPGGPQ